MKRGGKQGSVAFNDEQPALEFFANVLYAAMGVRVPKMMLYSVDVDIHSKSYGDLGQEALAGVLPSYVLLTEFIEGIDFKWADVSHQKAVQDVRGLVAGLALKTLAMKFEGRAYCTAIHWRACQ